MKAVFRNSDGVIVGIGGMQAGEGQAVIDIPPETIVHGRDPEFYVVLNPLGTPVFTAKSQVEVDAIIAARLQTQADIDTENNSLLADLANLVDTMSYADIETHINNVFGSLSTEQKGSLIKLYRTVLYLAKNR